ncbi:MAG TPA: NAD-dependent epimerase/dehydratase family protein [Dongiaceae bacterium]|jgi:UDP-glucuronate 4-epimerase|nr:NAD-dependent epimerase/dehydratase family protein [Dongiaceae bacterium]
MTVLVTGAAGFLGMHVARRLLQRGDRVIGVDNMDAYYSLELKEARLAELEEDPNFTFHYLDIGDPMAAAAVFALYPGLEGIVHLAAQVGVGHSLANPQAFLSTNISGMFVLLEECRKLPRLKNLVYGSSSAVYGGNRKVPFAESDPADQPRSVYAASKRADELFAAAYAHLTGVSMIGLRLFAIYGPWGRPDMFYYAFTRAIAERKPIRVYNKGDFRRDFTYVDDAVHAIVAALDQPLRRPEGAAGDAFIPHRIFNIGNDRSTSLGEFIAEIEKALGMTAVMENEPMKKDDLRETYADIALARAEFGFAPDTPIAEGVPRFVHWFRQFHRL